MRVLFANDIISDAIEGSWVREDANRINLKNHWFFDPIFQDSGLCVLQQVFLRFYSFHKLQNVLKRGIF